MTEISNVVFRFCVTRQTLILTPGRRASLKNLNHRLLMLSFMVHLWMPCTNCFPYKVWYKTDRVSLNRQSRNSRVNWTNTADVQKKIVQNRRVNNKFRFLVRLLFSMSEIETTKVDQTPAAAGMLSTRQALHHSASCAAFEKYLYNKVWWTISLYIILCLMCSLFIQWLTGHFISTIASGKTYLYM